VIERQADAVERAANATEHLARLRRQVASVRVRCCRARRTEKADRRRALPSTAADWADTAGPSVCLPDKDAMSVISTSESLPMSSVTAVAAPVARS
jgi:hypothetical protein